MLLRLVALLLIGLVLYLAVREAPKAASLVGEIGLWLLLMPLVLLLRWGSDLLMSSIDAFRCWGPAYWLRQRKQTSIAFVRASEMVKVVGIVVPRGDLLVAPFSACPCVAYWISVAGDTNQGWQPIRDHFSRRHG